MRTLTLLLSACGLLFETALAGRAAPPAFTKKPVAVRDGDTVKIDFAVNRPTDVAVFVEDARGKVVRHLVAGVLGKNPPPPLKADSLEQSVVWDGKADYGKPAEGGPFGVRVAIGLKVRYDRVAKSDPQSLGSIRSLAVGPD